MNLWLQFVDNWFRPKLEIEENALETFERLWSDQESGRRITFMSLAFNSSANTADSIEDFGLSYWSKRSIQQQVTYHWHIVEKVERRDVVVFGNPDAFDFGSTQPITANDVRTVLDDWVLSLSSNCDKLCIVAYGEQQIETLQKHWRSPVPITVMDLEAAWCQKHPETTESALEKVASASKETVDIPSTLDHSGNQANFILALLVSLVGKKDHLALHRESSYGEQNIRFDNI